MLIAICDDDLNFIKTIKEHLSFYSGEHNADFEIHTFTNSQNLINSNIKFNIINELYLVDYIDYIDYFVSI